MPSTIRPWLLSSCRHSNSNLGIWQAAPSLAAYSQRLRRLEETYGDDPILSKRLTILKDKQFLLTDYLNFPNASPFLAPLDRSMRFLDQKLQTFGQFWAKQKVNATLNAWAIINNFRTFLPDAKRAGQSLVEVFGACIAGYPLDGGAEPLHGRTIVRFGSSIRVRSIS